ncbi:hypothetical protein BB559_007271 [Furculomyces boomerangus]|uniref:BAR domain-containing protein n=1 Tax=Furculomyces boomerangus TaxID=61424 RepID=A0A2T9XY11_9FUNG|nr:hypothetical protein BB559_007271 [Furculomyces boomerangus]
MESFTKITQDINHSISPLTEKLGTNLVQLKQLVSEKFGENAKATSIPEEFILLEKKVEILKSLSTNFIQIGKSIAENDRAFEISNLQNQMYSYSASITQRFKSFTQSGQTAPQPQPTNTSDNKESYIPIYNKLSKVCLDSAEPVSLETPLGGALFKLGSIEKNIGIYKNNMDQSIKNDFVNKIEDFLNSKVLQVQFFHISIPNITATFLTHFLITKDKNKEVYKARLTLDAAKSNLASSKEAKKHIFIAEVQEAERDFDFCVNSSIKDMEKLLNSGDILTCILDLAKYQLDFYKEAGSIVGDLVPELARTSDMHRELYNSN